MAAVSGLPGCHRPVEAVCDDTTVPPSSPGAPRASSDPGGRSPLATAHDEPVVQWKEVRAASAVEHRRQLAGVLLTPALGLQCCTVNPRGSSKNKLPRGDGAPTAGQVLVRWLSLAFLLPSSAVRGALSLATPGAGPLHAELLSGGADLGRVASIDHRLDLHRAAEIDHDLTERDASHGICAPPGLLVKTRVPT
jgi:hypothetical protein